jgi:hypothetical protein
VATAVRRHQSVAEAMAYVERRLKDEIELADLPAARKRWQHKIRALSEG